MRERMYLDTMQTVLSQTTKVIVDGKSGNMLYLPLDKILREPTKSVAKVGKGPLLAENYQASHNGSNNSLVGDRPTTRLADRPGRG